MQVSLKVANRDFPLVRTEIRNLWRKVSIGVLFGIVIKYLNQMLDRLLLALALGILEFLTIFLLVRQLFFAPLRLRY